MLFLFSSAHQSSFIFENKKCHKLKIHRWGLISELLKDYNLPQFYRSALKQDKAVIDEVNSRSVQGMEAVEIHFRERGIKKMDKLLGSWWQGRGLCWLNEKEKRIYAAEFVAPKKIIKNLNWKEEIFKVFNMS